MTDSRTPRPHRPDPIGPGAVEPLAGRAQTIAKGWLLVLLERAPLEAVGTIPAAALAAEGPALCAAVIRGLGSDLELDRLRPDGDLAALVRRAGPLCGARDAAAAVGAVDALRACIWSAALEQRALERDPALLGQFADRLATVTAVVTATALTDASVAVGVPGDPVAPAIAPAAQHAPAAARDDAPAPHYAPAPAREDTDADPRYAPAAEMPGASAEATWSHLDPALDDLRDDEPPAPVTQLPERPAADPREGPVGGMDDSDLWIATLERHIDRCQREGGGLALLRVELVDAERVAASAPEGEAHVPYGRLAQAVRRAIRRQDLVASDHQGRAWVIAPGVGRAGAIALAERIGSGVEQGETWRGAPLAATIGFAVYGEDGRDAAMLIDRAEEAMLAATAAGVRIGEAIPQPESDGSSDRPGPRLVR